MLKAIGSGFVIGVVIGGTLALAIIGVFYLAGVV